jgi:hypothetical protein
VNFCEIGKSGGFSNFTLLCGGFLEFTHMFLTILDMHDCFLIFIAYFLLCYKRDDHIVPSRCSITPLQNDNALRASRSEVPN